MMRSGLNHQPKQDVLIWTMLTCADMKGLIVLKYITVYIASVLEFELRFLFVYTFVYTFLSQS